MHIAPSEPLLKPRDVTSPITKPEKLVSTTSGMTEAQVLANGVAWVFGEAGTRRRLRVAQNGSLHEVQRLLRGGPGRKPRRRRGLESSANRIAWVFSEA